MTETEQNQSVKSAGRKLVSIPVLLQDWDEEGEEHAARFWELFVDLLLVATASAVADGLKENPTVEGLSSFFCVYFIFFFGWYIYVHISTRFEDASLLHSFNLFFYLLGMASCVMNADGFNGRIRGFATSVCLQQISGLMMLVPIAFYIPRARPFCTVYSSVTVMGLLPLVASAIINTPRAAQYLWWMTAIIEFSLETIALFFLKGTRLVPIDIEHSVERHGCFVLVMLGETVLSVTLQYREHGEKINSSRRHDYYAVMVLSFLLIFMFALLFFHMEPSKNDHALHRSRFHGLTYIQAFKILGLALLAIGVAVKLIVESVAENEPLTEFASILIGVSVGMALLSLYVMRILNYGGKLPRPSDAPDVRRVMFAWWAVVGVAAILPFVVCFVLVRLGANDPISTLGTYSGIVTLLCVVETCFSHVLQPHLAKPLVNEVKESEPLMATISTDDPLQTYTTFQR